MPYFSQDTIVLDPAKFPEQVKENLINFLNDIELKAFRGKRDIDLHTYLAEAAVKQISVGRTDLIVNKNNPSDIELETELDDNFDEDDYAFELRLPFLTAQAEAMFGHAMQAILPADKKFFGLNLSEFEDLASWSPKFVALLQDCFESFGVKSFNALNMEEKLAKGILQLIIAGNNPAQVEYNPDEGLLDLTILNLKRFAVYPFKEDIRNSNFIYRYHVFMPDLEADPGINKDLLVDIVPELEINTDYASYISQDTSTLAAAGQEDSPYDHYAQVPYGYIAAVNYFIPYFNTTVGTGKKKKPFVLRNCLITVLRDTHLRDNKDSDFKRKSQIVKIIQFDNRKLNPMHFSTWGTVLPNTVYCQSKIYQNTPFLAMANMITNIAMQAYTLSVNPIIKKKDYGDETEDDIEYTPRMVWALKNMEDVQVVESPFNLDTYIGAMKFLYSLVQQSGGITEMLEGTKANPSERKTKFEAESLYESGSVRVNASVMHVLRDFLHNIVYKYFSLTQFFLRYQKEAIYASMKDNIIEEKKFAEFEKRSKLWKNFLTMSKIKTRLTKLIKDLTLSGVSENLQEAKRLEVFTDSETLFDLVTTPITLSDITIEGNPAEIKRTFQLQAIQFIMDLITKVPIEERTGKVINFEEILRHIKQLLEVSDVEFLSDPSKVIPNPQLKQAILSGQLQTTYEGVEGGGAAPATPTSEQPEV